MAILLLQLLLLAAIHPRVVVSIGSLGTFGPLWSKWANGSDARTGVSNTYALCILQSETLDPICWGTFARDNDTLAPGSSQLRGLNSGDSFSCGLLYASGRPICWGKSEVSVPSQYQNVSYTSMSVGGFHVCALTSLGGVDCWGGNGDGQASPPTNETFTSVASGLSFSCGLRSSGRVVCWGNFDNLVRLTPPLLFKSIFAGGFHACGIQQVNDEIVCWGDPTFGQTSPPANVDSSFTSMALGLYHSCGLRKDNHKVVCWGDDVFSQVKNAPVDEPFSIIAAADLYTCGVSMIQMGTVKCWGSSTFSTDDQPQASQGLCQSGECTASLQYQLTNSNNTSCPAAGDKICLDCLSECVEGVNQPPSCICKKAKKKSSTTWIIIGSVVGGVSVLALVLVLVIWCKGRKKEGPGWQRLIPFTSSQLKLATNNFSDEMVVGRGGQGVVYKGILPDGQVVAIKKETSAPDDNVTLKKEIELLGRLNHAFLVNLVGYCYSERLLVYEFMENGSLADCLFKKPHLRFGLGLRVRIAAQSARGLEYLHSYATPRIIHRDVKSANILLDKDWNAHVADFGLSTFGPQGVPLFPPVIPPERLQADKEDPEGRTSMTRNATHLSSVTVVGTPGYLDPEYWQTGQLNWRSDVYSFGVVLLELLTGKKADWRSFVDEFALDPKISSVANQPALEKLHGLAKECMQKDRPNMGTVASVLEQVLNSLSDIDEVVEAWEEGSSTREESHSNAFSDEASLAR